MITRLWRWLNGRRDDREVVHCPHCDPYGERMKTATINWRHSQPGGPLWHCFRCDKGGVWAE